MTSAHRPRSRARTDIDRARVQPASANALSTCGREPTIRMLVTSVSRLRFADCVRNGSDWTMAERAGSAGGDGGVGTGSAISSGASSTRVSSTPGG